MIVLHILVMLIVAVIVTIIGAKFKYRNSPKPPPRYRHGKRVG